MRLNKKVLFVFMIIFLLSLNFIVAKDINETNLNADSFEIDYDDSISSSYDTNLQKLNQNDTVKADELLEKSDNSSNRILNEDNSSIGLLNDGDGLKHLYVAPNATGSGLDKNDPGDFITILNNTEDNTVIHMLEGTYLLSNITPIKEEFYLFISIKSKNNISIVGENPDKVKIISNLTHKANRPAVIFNLYNNTNLNLKILHSALSKKIPKYKG